MAFRDFGTGLEPRRLDLPQTLRSPDTVSWAWFGLLIAGVCLAPALAVAWLLPVTFPVIVLGVVALGWLAIRDFRAQLKTHVTITDTIVESWLRGKLRFSVNRDDIVAVGVLNRGPDYEVRVMGRPKAPVVVLEMADGSVKSLGGLTFGFRHDTRDPGSDPWIQARQVGLLLAVPCRFAEIGLPTDGLGRPGPPAGS